LPFQANLGGICGEDGDKIKNHQKGGKIFNRFLKKYY
jgi:hypothetical protein